MQLSEITDLHIELSSKCNAWCPGCPRNLNGYGLNPNLDPTNLDLSKIDNALQKLPNLKNVQLCGRFGDPLMHPEFEDVIDRFLQRSLFLKIHTNGSIRNRQWWADLGKTLNNKSHIVWFGIDGLEDTHSLYRQGTDFHKIIDNAKFFIDNGGKAIWQFLPFKHNEHQIKDCMKLAKSLGFADFKLVEGVRNPKVARNYETGQEYELLPWSKTIEKNFREFAVKTLGVENCHHLLINSLYITASGKYTLCCHFDSVYPEHDPILFDTLEETVPLDIKQEIETTPRQLCVRACANLSYKKKFFTLNSKEKVNDN